MALIKNGPTSSLIEKQEEQNKLTGFTIRDTDFLIRLVSSSHILGSDLNQANSTLTKLRTIHERLSNAIEKVI